MVVSVPLASRNRYIFQPSWRLHCMGDLQIILLLTFLGGKALGRCSVLWTRPLGRMEV